jgi:two-component system response regulator MprA
MEPETVAAPLEARKLGLKGAILVVEDEGLTRAAILRTLTRCGFQAIGAGSGEEALARLKTRRFDLLVLDILLPGMDGFGVCRQIRAQDRGMAIIMLTSLTSMKDRLHGLDLGADDYMVKPFAPEELLARIRAVLRRSQPAPAQAATLEIANLKLDFLTQDCSKNQRKLELTPLEFRLLALLCEHRDQAVSRANLFTRVWGENHHGSDKCLDVYIGRLRQKIEDDPGDPSLIHTVRGYGYCFESPREHPAGIGSVVVGCHREGAGK